MLALDADLAHNTMYAECLTQNGSREYSGGGGGGGGGDVCVLLSSVDL